MYSYSKDEKAVCFSVGQKDPGSDDIIRKLYWFNLQLQKITEIQAVATLKYCLLCVPIRSAGFFSPKQQVTGKQSAAQFVINYACCTCRYHKGPTFQSSHLGDKRHVLLPGLVVMLNCKSIRRWNIQYIDKNRTCEELTYEQWQEVLSQFISLFISAFLLPVSHCQCASMSVFSALSAPCSSVSVWLCAKNTHTHTHIQELYLA